MAMSARRRPVVDFATVRDGLAGFLKLQWAEKRDGNLVYLGPEECVRMDREVSRPEFWDAHSDDVDQSFRSDADQNGAKRRRALSV